MINRIFTLMFIILISLSSFAFEPIALKGAQGFSRFDQVIELNQGETIRLLGTYSYNTQGEKQLYIYLKESHILSFDTEQLVVIGKDINDDGLIDTWFYQNASGSIDFIRSTIKNDFDFSGMKPIFAGIFDSGGRWTVSILMKYAFQNLTLTGSDEFIFWANYERRQIELIDLELRLTDLLRKFPNDPMLNNFRQINADCWLTLFEEFSRHKGRDRLTMVGADVGLYLAGSLVFKGITLVGKFAISKIGLEETIETVTKMGEEHYRRLKTRLANAKTDMHLHIQKHLDIKKTMSYGILVRLAQVPLLERPALIIEDLVLKSRLSQVLRTDYRYFAEGLKEVAANKAYIGYSTAIQLGAELFARGYFSFSDVPIILDSPVKGAEDIAIKVGTDKDLLQNLAYMTVETANAAGISRVLELKGVSLPKRFIICGIASTIDSMFMAKVVKGEVNPGRIVGDTAWEVIVGNSQVLFDLWQWQKWKDLAHSSGIKQLKLVGVMITFVHQASGYYYYSKWADLWEGKTSSSNDPKLNGPKNDAKQKKEPSLQPILIPILAP